MDLSSVLRHSIGWGLEVRQEVDDLRGDALGLLDPAEVSSTFKGVKLRVGQQARELSSIGIWDYAVVRPVKYEGGHPYASDVQPVGEVAGAGFVLGLPGVFGGGLLEARLQDCLERLGVVLGPSGPERKRHSGAGEFLGGSAYRGRPRRTGRLRHIHGAGPPSARGDQRQGLDQRGVLKGQLQGDVPAE